MVMSARQTGHGLPILSRWRIHDSQNRWWPHGTSARYYQLVAVHVAQGGCRCFLEISDDLRLLKLWLHGVNPPQHCLVQHGSLSCHDGEACWERILGMRYKYGEELMIYDDTTRNVASTYTTCADRRRLSWSSLANTSAEPPSSVVTSQQWYKTVASFLISPRISAWCVHIQRKLLQLADVMGPAFVILFCVSHVLGLLLNNWMCA